MNARAKNDSRNAQTRRSSLVLDGIISARTRHLIASDAVKLRPWTMLPHGQLELHAFR